MILLAAVPASPMMPLWNVHCKLNEIVFLTLSNGSDSLIICCIEVKEAEKWFALM